MRDRATDTDADAAPTSHPLDRVGIACLAWTGVFIALTAVLAVTLH